MFMETENPTLGESARKKDPRTALPPLPKALPSYPTYLADPNPDY